jgi:hypothetical protein
MRAQPGLILFAVRLLAECLGAPTVALRPSPPQPETTSPQKAW